MRYWPILLRSSFVLGVAVSAVTYSYLVLLLQALALCAFGLSCLFAIGQFCCLPALSSARPLAVSPCSLLGPCLRVLLACRDAFLLSLLLWAAPLCAVGQSCLHVAFSPLLLPSAASALSLQLLLLHPRLPPGRQLFLLRASRLLPTPFSSLQPALSPPCGRAAAFLATCRRLLPGATPWLIAGGPRLFWLRASLPFLLPAAGRRLFLATCQPHTPQLFWLRASRLLPGGLAGGRRLFWLCASRLLPSPLLAFRHGFWPRASCLRLSLPPSLPPLPSRQLGLHYARPSRTLRGGRP